MQESQLNHEVEQLAALQYRQPVNVTKRYRINVSTSVKGQHTYDCTVDVEGMSMEEVLGESDRLVYLLDQRYPAPAP